jgi:hypothetical protein
MTLALTQAMPSPQGMSCRLPDNTIKKHNC